jgi:hypothetical protein
MEEELKRKIAEMMMRGAGQQVSPSSGWGDMRRGEPMPVNTYGADALFRDAGGTGIYDQFTLGGNYKARR